MPDIITLIQHGGALFVFKILLLVAMFVFILFSFILINRVRALNRTIFLAAAHASSSLFVITFILFFLAISLFVITLVIV